MQPFAYSRAHSLADAVAASARGDAALIAGGTELVNWLKEGIVAPARVVDISRLPGLNEISIDSSGLHLGALAHMSDVTANAAVRREYPVVAEALERSASMQLRNMATMGGNLLQRTRCPYFRAETELPCNKRKPGSGCSAVHGETRTQAIFGWSQHCVATHPSDVAVAFAALDALVRVHGVAGARTIRLTDLHRLPGDTPERDNALAPGDVIIGIDVPASPLSRRSHYLKLRERASYEFALVSVAVAVDLDGRTIRDARVALGGVAHKPWRLVDAEPALHGVSLDDHDALRAAVTRGFTTARPLEHNGFKVELATRAVVRALQTVGGIA